ncbi:hypothetical protein [Pseudomonas auratipiscis]|uniref:DUF1983 domain-containing protein n=1 Tax=Pseudomonas auratipiscis TaxID=3115853 RepID=A0AB35WWM0_9PSED|nr:MULTISPECIES: hypothetical protein [unclassified Pseudomonas]MEE1869081.1 hypothetical protein [Pseudomonas sp. 120P]MEE1959728.1 hypothetical protein [Pseudomonas sp. 119P]
MQSADYVPKVSGWKMDSHTGSLEINSGNVAVGTMPSDPQMITVTAGEWPESDLPSNAIERYKFIGEHLMQVPLENRDSAEFSTEDISFDRDGSDIRTTLTYQRLETEQEAAARVARSVGSGVTIQAGNITITCGDKVVARMGCGLGDERPDGQGFVVEGDQVFISQALITASITEEASTRASADGALASRIGALEARIFRADDSDGALRDALTDWKPCTALLAGQFLVAADQFAVTMAENTNGDYVCTGIGLGIDPSKGETKDGQADMERAIEKGDAAEILRLLSRQITESELGQELRDKIDTMECVREVISKELRPGGLLHRR